MRLCYGSQRRIFFKERKDLSFVKNRERGSSRVFERSIKKGVYLTIEVATDVASILCAKEEWKWWSSKVHINMKILLR